MWYEKSLQHYSSKETSSETDAVIMKELKVAGFLNNSFVINRLSMELCDSLFHAKVPVFSYFNFPFGVFIMSFFRNW